MKKHRIAVIAGDGIGKEVVPEGIRVLEAAGAKFGLAFQWDELPWSCAYYAKTGRDDAGGRARPDPRPRRDLPRRGRLPGRPRPRLALGAPDPDPPAVPTST